MAKTDYVSVDQYLKAQPPHVRDVLQRVRAVLKEALPDAQEGISYQIPVLRQQGAAVIYFAGWKHHFSLYPVGERVPIELQRELARYPMAKGTIRFPLEEPVPSALLARIAQVRAEETLEGLAVRRQKPAPSKDPKSTAKKSSAKKSSAKK